MKLYVSLFHARHCNPTCHFMGSSVDHVEKKGNVWRQPFFTHHPGHAQPTDKRGADELWHDYHTPPADPGWVVTVSDGPP